MRSSSGSTTMSTRAPLRHTVTSMRRPMACSTISRWMPVALVTGLPSTLMTMSPRRVPAAAAGLPATTEATCMPVRDPTRAASSGVRVI